MISSTRETLYRLDNLNNEQQRITYQMSTGKKLQYGSDDANTYAREVYIEDRIRMYEGLQSQIEKTTAQNKGSDSTLADAKDLLAYVKTEVLKALNATTDDTGKLAIATNLEGVKENLYMLANEQVEGEYLFAGSDSSVQAFSWDESTGKVTYNGDAQLRKVAVEEGSYRERGVNGFEAFFYATSTAYKGGTLEFSQDQVIVDQNGNEWQVHEQVASGEVLTFDSTTPIIDGDKQTWTLDNTTDPLNPVLVDDSGTLASIPVTDNGDGTFSVTVPNTVDSLGFNQLVRYDNNGHVIAGEALDISGSYPDSLSVVLPNDDGIKFEAKANVFDTLDSIINALKKVDDLGNPIDSDASNDALRVGLDEISEAYDGMNIAHGKLGGRNQVFEISLERVTAKVTQYNILQQEVGAADLSKVAVEAKALELTYTALYSTINKMNELSLVNFVR